MTFIKMYRFLQHMLWLLLFPMPKMVVEIEKMSAQEFKNRVMVSNKTNALFSYRDPLVQTLIWNMKYRKRRTFFKLAGEIIKQELIKIKNNPLIIPVPLSDKRQRERGYNQTEEILRYCSGYHCLGFEIRTDIIKKIIHTKNQTKLNRKDRKKNLKGAFVVKNKKAVLGRNIIIFDDVVTTGTTFLEITSVLKEAGAKEIFTLALAH